jgi:hypothetical protein
MGDSMNAAEAAVIIGGLITASGAGVYIQTKWFSNFPGGQATKLRFSWTTVVIGLVVLAAGVLMTVLQGGVHLPAGGGGGAGSGGGGGGALNIIRHVLGG